MNTRTQDEPIRFSAPLTHALAELSARELEAERRFTLRGNLRAEDVAKLFTEASDYRVDAALTNLATKRKANRYAAPFVLPDMPVNFQTGKYWARDPYKDELRQNEDIRAIGTEPLSAYVGIPSSSAGYTVDDHALQDALPIEISSNADPAVQAELDKVAKIRNMLALNEEIELVANLGTYVTTTDTPTTKFDNYDAGADDDDPVQFITSQYYKIEDAVGASPNLLVLDSKVAIALFNSPEFRERMKYTLPPNQTGPTEDIMQRALAAILGLEQVRITSGLKNTAKKGQTASTSRIWGDTCLLAYVEPPSLEYAGLGQTFVWRTGGGAAVDGLLVEREYVMRKRSDIFYVHRYRCQKIINATAGVLLTDTLT